MVYYNEIDPWCCEVLRARIEDRGLWKGFVDERDIRQVDATDLVRFHQWHLFSGIGGMPLGLKWAGIGPEESILTGGFPCQDISAAGKGAGIEGNRSGLWREMFRIIRTVRPDWLLIENVPVLRTRGADRVIAPLERIGYACWPSVVGAWAVGAPQKRDRVWIVGRLANTNGKHGERGMPEQIGKAQERTVIGRSSHAGLANALGLGSGPGSEPQQPFGSERRFRCDADWSGETGVAHSKSQRKRESSDQTNSLATFGQTRDELGNGGELANSNIAGHSQRESESRNDEPQLPTFERGGRVWPARPGELQHEWEAPRLVESGLGGATDGLSRRLAREASRERKHRLKAFGNSVCPQVVEVFGKWIVTQLAAAGGKE